MKNRELYVKDPGAMRLLNNGVAEVAEVDTEALRQTLRFELETFVCKGEYQRGLVKIMESFLRNLGQPEQPPVWVSGFYGSGKSHLIKMLRYLWVDYVFPDGATARGLASLSSDVNDLLTELSTRGKQFGGLHAASGKLGAGAGNSIRLAVLAIIFPSAGLPKEYAQARFVIWLKQNGFYKTVRSHVEAAGKQFDQELRHLYVSPHLAEGLLAADSDFASSAKEVRSLVKEQFHTQRHYRRRDAGRYSRCPGRLRRKAPLHAVGLRRDSAVHRRRTRPQPAGVRTRRGHGQAC